METLRITLLSSADGYAASSMENISGNFFNRHITPRIVHLVEIPLSVVAIVGDTLSGVIAGAATIVTGGVDRNMYSFAASHLYSTQLLISGPLRYVVQTINPNAQFRDPSDGIFAGDIRDRCTGAAKDFARSNNFFARNITSRLAYVVALVATIIARVVDLVIGVLATPFALITLGNYQQLNSLAYRGLQVTGIVGDIFKCAVGIVNPHAPFLR